MTMLPKLAAPARRRRAAHRQDVVGEVGQVQRPIALGFVPLSIDHQLTGDHVLLDLRYGEPWNEAGALRPGQRDPRAAEALLDVHGRRLAALRLNSGQPDLRAVDDSGT
jgi:hypothetical protein